MTRKHKGIHQSGGKKGQLKGGYIFTGGKTKTGLPIIKKITKKKVTKKVVGGNKKCLYLNKIREEAYRFQKVSNGRWPSAFDPCDACKCTGKSEARSKDCTQCAFYQYKLYTQGIISKKEFTEYLKRAENLKK